MYGEKQINIHISYRHTSILVNNLYDIVRCLCIQIYLYTSFRAIYKNDGKSKGGQSNAFIQGIYVKSCVAKTKK